MVTVAIGTLRNGLTGLIACFVVVFTGAVVLLLCGGLVETGVSAAGSHAAKVLVPIGAVFGGLCVLLTVIIVGSTLSLVIRQRARDLALLRAIGASASFVRATLMLEVLCTSFAAIILAWLPSLLLGGVLVTLLAGNGTLSEGVAFTSGPIPLVCATGATMGSALLAVVVNSTELTRLRPAIALGAAVRSRSMSPVRLFCAIACLGGGIALSSVTANVMHGPVASATAGPAALLWAGGLALLSPVIGRVVGWVAMPIVSASAAGYLAARSTVRRPAETAGIITPVLLVVGLAGAFVLMERSESLFASGSSDATASWINVLLIVLIVGYALVSLINSSVTSIGGRRGEFSLLRLSGLTRSGLLAMIAVESLIASLAGVVLGLVVVVAVVGPYNIGLADDPFVGFAGTPALFGGIAVATVIVTMGTTNLVARITTRSLVPDVTVG